MFQIDGAATRKARPAITVRTRGMCNNGRSDERNVLVQLRAVRRLYIPNVRTVIAGRAFRVAAPSIWNTLPRPVSSRDNITSFKRRLKTHLFTSVFEQILHVM